MAVDRSKQRWKLDHNPFERPLGCDGKYGSAGASRHYKRKEKPCNDCRISLNHSRRELRRGERVVRPPGGKCGTSAGARMHYRRGEELCRPCKLADAEAARIRYYARKAKRQAVLGYACYPLPHLISEAVFG